MKKCYILGILFTILVGACSDKVPDGTIPSVQPHSSDTQGNADWKSVIHISDPALLREVHDFTYYCYDMTKLSGQTSESEGENWVGSQYYLEKYYPDIYTPFFRAKWLEGVWTHDGINTTDDGLTCKEWWEDNKRGLYAKLLNVVDDPKLLTRIGVWTEPTPQLKTLGDFQKFIEQGAACQNEWSEEMLIQHHAFDQYQENDLRAINEMARNVGLETELELTVGRHLILRPRDQKINIYGFDLKAAYLSAGFFAVILDADKKAIFEKMKALGLKQHPQMRPWWEGMYYLAPVENYLSASHTEAILIDKMEKFQERGTIGKCEEGTQQSPVCQIKKSSGMIGCHGLLSEEEEEANAP